VNKVVKKSRSDIERSKQKKALDKERKNRKKAADKEFRGIFRF
jgi:hypothetical protein